MLKHIPPPRSAPGRRREDASPVKGRRPKPALAAGAPSPAISFPIVGVGASAGGLEAFRRLLAALPGDSGMAYVLLQHLDPRHESILAELLAKATPMPIAEVEDGLAVEPNRVYIIPPSRDIAIVDGALKLVPRTTTGGLHMPIDYFFRTLAEVRRSQAIGVVLSGTGSDGTLGLKAIKAEGGIAFAQDPESAQHDAMPRNAIAGGAVDFVLTPEGIARELERLGRHAYVAPGDRVEAGAPSSTSEGEEDGLRKILGLLLRTTGTDFSAYKKATLGRRIERRMVLRRFETLEDYARHLEGDAEEVQALQQDFLITVTSFFRDPQVFAALGEQVFPRLLADRPPASPVRVWVPGCATGEEAYSIAIGLLEHAGEPAATPSPQIFATDLSESAIHKARAGKYLENIAQDVSPERLRRFFSKVDGHYQISKAVREMCVFARHDLVRDAPFSNMDLISCRNLLIYLEPPLQEKVLATFSYALRDRRFLLLGPSETASPSPAIFAAVDKKHRIYVRQPMAGRRVFQPAPRAAAGERSDAGSGGTAAAAKKSRLEAPQEADRILLARYAPPGVLIDHDLNILEFRGDTHPYLEHAHGPATLSLMKMARPGLVQPLRHAIQEAKSTQAPVRREGVQVRYHGRVRRLRLDVLPVQGTAAAERCLLVLFAEGPEPPPGRDRRRPVIEGAKDGEIAHLVQELAETRRYLQTVIQEHEAAREELQASNEEVLSSNEELRSVNEELETAKEEVQSTNEELTTLNQELRDRNLQLGQLNDDLLNLLASVHVPIVMVGNDLRLRRFTVAAEKPLNLIPTDVGRPLGDLRTNLDVPDLEREVRDVIEAASPAEREVKDRQGRCFVMRIFPYETRENKIDGAVLLLVDVDVLKRGAEKVARALEFANAIVDTVHEPLLILDGDLRVARANRAFYDGFRVAPEETEGRLLFALADGLCDVPDLRAALAETLAGDREIEDFVIEHEFPGRGPKTMVLNARRLPHEEIDGARLLLAIADRTAVALAARERETLLELERTARQRAEAGDRVKDEFVATVSHELRGPLTAMTGWIHLLRGGGGVIDEAQHARGLAAIDRGIQAQARLIEDLLDHSRIVTGQLSLMHRLVDLREIVESVVQALRTAAAAKDLRLEHEHGGSPGPLWVQGDPHRLQQVAWNLLSNAVKFTPNGGFVGVWTGRVETSATLVVTDTGQGIPADFLPHVFERFRRAEGAANRSHSGLGLGLSIVRQLVELHGGKVRAESPGEGRGAVFTMEIPIPALRSGPEGLEVEEPEVMMPVAGEGAPPAPATSLLAGVRLLVVEDEADAREGLGALLEMYGARVTLAASAGEALAAIASELPDVLVSDIGMPGEDGYDLIRKVRRLPARRGGRLPALALTAYNEEEDRRKAAAAGFQEHVAKPVAPAALVVKIAQLAGCG
jgi:two-component system, chemotaxis family, CheB/CheR fusion protein